MTNDELLLCASSVVFFSFLFNKHQHCSFVRRYRAAKGMREHKHIYTYRKKDRDTTLVCSLIKVTLATTNSLFSSCMLCSFISLYRLDVSIMIRVVLFPFLFTLNMHILHHILHL